MAWPPTPTEFYLPPDETRPVFQGDVFRDVPFVKVKSGGGSPEVGPDIVCERRHVVPVLHPCDMYANGGRALNRVQSVALVRKAAGFVTIPTNWGGAFAVCPLPDLLGDGEMWVADFNAVSNVDRSFLTLDRRIRCLAQVGWQVFRQRYALAGTRTLISLDDLDRAGDTTWREALYETEWRRAGRDSSSYHDWLDEADPNLGGLTRRAGLERGLYHAVRSSLAEELDA